jgi:hypothetical protein
MRVTPVTSSAATVAETASPNPAKSSFFIAYLSRNQYLTM